MIERITEQNSWDFLKSTPLPIVIYGMGNGADMVIDVLEERGIPYCDVFASDGFVRGQSFHGKRVLTLAEVEAKYGDFVIVMSFAVHDEKTFLSIKSMAQRHTFLAPTVPIAGKGLFSKEYIEEHDAEFEKAFNMLADEKSKQAFVDVLNFKVSGKIEYLFKCQSEKDEVYSNILKLGERETILDLGAYDGDTVREFLQFTNGKYDRIFCFEPDAKNFKKLLAKTEGLSKLVALPLGAWNKRETLIFEKKSGRNSHKGDIGIPVEFDTPDNVIKEPVTFIKMDIEGAEAKAIEGSRRLIESYKPKLYICAYHRNEDFFDIPFRVSAIRSDYKIYFRHHPYIPAWESNFYFV